VTEAAVPTEMELDPALGRAYLKKSYLGVDFLSALGRITGFALSGTSLAAPRLAAVAATALLESFGANVVNPSGSFTNRTSLGSQIGLIKAWINNSTIPNPSSISDLFFDPGNLGALNLGALLHDIEHAPPLPPYNAEALPVLIARDIHEEALRVCKEILSSLDDGEEETSRNVATVRLQDVFRICRAFVDSLIADLASHLDHDPDTLDFLWTKTLVPAPGIEEATKRNIFTSFAHHPSASVRYSAVCALDALGTKGSRETLRGLARFEKNPDVRSMIEASIKSS
jgi:hypothetical protein